jgi:hypothetical protein
MNLQDFVSQALVQIASGLRAADVELSALGAIVNPRHVAGAGADKANVYGYLVEQGTTLRRAVHSVEFDIAVTANEGKETKGGIGIVVGAIGIGSQGRSEEANSSVSRIKFKVPIALPNSVQEP